MRPWRAGHVLPSAAVFQRRAALAQTIPLLLFLPSSPSQTMERVQYQLERSLPELQQLDQEGVFTKVRAWSDEFSPRRTAH